MGHADSPGSDLALAYGLQDRLQGEPKCIVAGWRDGGLRSRRTECPGFGTLGLNIPVRS